MKRLLPWVALGLLVGSLLWSALHRGHEHAALEGQPMPALAVQDLAGRQSTLATWPAKVTVVNVWASWCPPCLEEMPSLERLHRQLGGEGLVVMGLNVDATVPEAELVLKKVGVTYANVHDPDGHRVLQALDVEGLPTTFVVGQDGRVIEVLSGIADFDTPRAIDYFRGLLRASTSPIR